MKIVFACPHCAKQLVADAALAGRTGRCRYCGQRTVVPSSTSASGGPGRAGSETQARAQAAVDWRAAVAQQLQTSAGGAGAGAMPDKPGGYTLRPVTPVGVPALASSDWSNAELGPAVASPPTVFTSPTVPVRSDPARSGPKPSRGPRPASPGVPASTPASTDLLAMAKSLLAALAAIVSPGTMRPSPGGAAPALVAYRTFFGLLGRVTAWISETSYTVSFIVIILALASGMIGRHSLAAYGCGAVVALNLVGLAGDVASLLTLSFRKNPLQGVLFFVPPFTLYYLWTDWQRYRDTIGRMRIPLLTLAAVGVAYLFVPWLHGGSKEEGRIVASVKQAIGTAEEKLAGRKGALDDGLKQAREWLREVPLPDPSSLPGSHGDRRPSPDGKP